MLFHTFASQDARRACGDSDWIELQRCKHPRGTPLAQLLANEAIRHWNNDSLYLHGDDTALFCALYADIFGTGVYANGSEGLMDCCGLNYYTPQRTLRIAQRLKAARPLDFVVLLNWLADTTAYNGIYLLGL